MAESGDAEQRDALLDDLLVRARNRPDTYLPAIKDAITELRQRVAAAENGRNEWAAASCELVMCHSALAQAEGQIVERDRRIAELDKALTWALDAIREALEFCEDREDIVDGEFGPLPNDFMHIATILKGRQA